jgi:glutamate N-acetyltransferase/amino-acid acetyltransferase
MDIKFIDGGITAPAGFKAGGVHCGIRRNTSKLDLMMILSDVNCTASAVYTQNTVKGAPIIVTKANIDDGKARGVIANSGNANTCNADGEEKAHAMCALAARVSGLAPTDFAVASTGVIGQTLNIEPIANSIGALYADLAADADASDRAARAIMTTDTVKKELCVQIDIGGKPVKIGAIAKGSGMIHPNMATMLGFVTTDAVISRAALDKALAYAVGESINMISVDGDMSTNDTVLILASGLAGNAEIAEQSESFKIFCLALTVLLKKIARTLAKDGEGATKLIECSISGAPDIATAKRLAKAVIVSPLVKTMIFGADANFGRILCALGYASVGEDKTVFTDNVDVMFMSGFDTLSVCKNSKGIAFDEEKAKALLSNDEILIDININMGDASAMAWGCDLTYDYVKINGDYRT